MNIVIIDDELEAQNNLKALLNDYCKDFTIMGEADGVKSGVKLIKEVNPDTIFLDIKMGDGTGFDLLDLIPIQEFSIVFVTAFDFAIKAFNEYDAAYYLLKPIDPKELVSLVERLNKDLKVKTQTLTLSTQEGVYCVKLKDIMWIKADKNYSIFNLKKGEKITVSKSLGTYEKILPKKTFFRSHQSFIVNRYYVYLLSKEDGGNIILDNRQNIQISRRKKDEFIKWLQNE